MSSLRFVDQDWLEFKIKSIILEGGEISALKNALEMLRKYD